ncbi:MULTISPECIES: DUF6230 family protein [Streptomyces]|uniref:Cholesterol esterase n=1 Tax=Streptomyces physcomitrii TaxID=2724184 RepID=A0ABX1H444_9ACTN|nr:MULTISPECIES: DUF6230 family protein [Streptomyces]NKI43136.1 cholesterol esterase [Streptomyces physcomitrii]
MISGQDRAPAPGRTRWLRLAVVMVPTLVVSGGVVASMATGALAASFGVSANSFTVSGQSFQISADSLSGKGFQQYGVLDRGKRATYPEALTGVRSADLRNLCQSVVQQVPVLGPVTLSLTAGTGRTPVHADRLIADAHDLKGDASFKNIEIGRDASTVDAVPGVAGPEGGFALQSDTIDIKRLRQETRSVSAATFKLPGLHLTVKRGDHSCF